MEVVIVVRIHAREPTDTLDPPAVVVVVQGAGEPGVPGEPVSQPRPVAAIVLAAGEGRRMHSTTPKVLHEVAGRSLLCHVLQTARALGPDEILVVVGHEKERVAAHVLALDLGARTVVQAEQLGTGHAVRLALATVATDGGVVIVLAGDTPLLSPGTLDNLLSRHHESGAVATVLTAVVEDSMGYGRVLRNPDLLVEGIVEERDATPEQRNVHEVNSGVYAFDLTVLRDALSRLDRDNSQGEEYLTDVIGLLASDGRRVAAVVVDDAVEVLGVNDRVQLARAGASLRDRLLTGWMRAGVTVVDPASVWLDTGVVLAAEVTLLPGVQLHGATVIASGAIIGPDSTLRDTVVGAGARVVRSHLDGAEVADGAVVGPFAYVRPGTELGVGGRIGAFVEVKNSTIGAGSKVPHLSYVGDAEIGEGANIGAATVFVNYDGVDKHRTVIGDHVRVGSDNMLIAPVTIGDGAYTAAGSVIDQDVPPGAMGVGRARQRNIEGWVARKRAGTRAHEAASRALQASEGAQSSAGSPPGESSDLPDPSDPSDPSEGAASSPDAHEGPSV